MAVKEAAEDLAQALEAVPDVRVYTDPGATVDPPGVVVGPPQLVWETGCAEPTSATFLVYVVEKQEKRALERLWELVPQVTAALDGLPAAAVRRADPGSWLDQLPAYVISCEVSL